MTESSAAGGGLSLSLSAAGAADSGSSNVDQLGAGAGGEGTAGAVSAKKVHISNLPPGTTEQHLIEIFSPCGPISFARIIINQNEHVFAFVEFMDIGGAQAAFALNGVTLGGLTPTPTPTLSLGLTPTPPPPYP